ncbi:MAG: penicillin-binding protein 2 [Gammaproteobacteria bacterium]
MATYNLDTHVKEIRIFRGRTLVAVLFSFLLMAALAARLVYLQVLNHEVYATRSDENRLKIIAVPPIRGLIYDRNGVLLAENRPSYTLEITPEQTPDLDAALDELGKLIQLDERDLKRFHRLRRRKPAFEGIPLRTQLSDEEVARIAVNRHRLRGVEIATRLTRHYPAGTEMAHVVGYVGRIDEDELRKLEDPANYAGTNHIGKVGVESAYEDTLHGFVGLRRVEINAAGRVVRVIEDIPSQPGQNLYLSVDSRLQKVADEALGDYNGSVVAIDPRNGDVLALVSKPGYDANLFVNGIGVKDYRALADDRKRPLFNRALRGQYPPGSTVKPFFALASLEMGLNTYDRTMFAGPYFQLPGQSHKYRDWKKTGHGWVSMDAAIVQSCDVYFYDLAVKMGIERMHDFMSQFSFGKRTGIDIGGEVGGLFPSPEWKRRAKGQVWFPGETVITGIGQGYTLSTPLQLAAATATLGNRGIGYKPRVVHAVKDPATETQAEQPPRSQDPMPITEQDNWVNVIQSMVNVVHSPRGTARRISRGLGDIHVAGKTGTAQVFTVAQDEEYNEDEIAHHLRDHALFVAFAPAEAPEIAIAVVVENGGHGGSTAAPVARKVLDQYFGLGEPLQADTGSRPAGDPRT